MIVVDEWLENTTSCEGAESFDIRRMSDWRKTEDEGESKECLEILVGGFNPIEFFSEIGSFPQVGVKIKNIENHHLEKNAKKFHCVAPKLQPTYRPPKKYNYGWKKG